MTAFIARLAGAGGQGSRRRLVKIKAAVLSAFFVAAGTASATAQVGFAPYPSDIIPPYEVAAIVNSLRLTPISRPVLWGSTYVVRAVDRDGEVVRVIIDAEEGEVLAVRHLYGGRFAGRYSRFGPLAPDLDESLPPVPPRGVPRSARPPMENRSAAIAPVAPPLPRPRPGLAAAPERPAAAEPAVVRAAPPQPAPETTGSIPAPQSEARPSSEPAPSSFPAVAPLE